MEIVEKKLLVRSYKHTTCFIISVSFSNYAVQTHYGSYLSSTL